MQCCIRSPMCVPSMTSPQRLCNRCLWQGHGVLLWPDLSCALEMWFICQEVAYCCICQMAVMMGKHFKGSNPDGAVCALCAEHIMCLGLVACVQWLEWELKQFCFLSLETSSFWKLLLLTSYPFKDKASEMICIHGRYLQDQFTIFYSYSHCLDVCSHGITKSAWLAAAFVSKQGNPKLVLKHCDINTLHLYFDLCYSLPQYLKIKWAERKTLCFVTAVLATERQRHV